jgi:predicted GTPase
VADHVRKAVILGAAGRDFHNFNVFFRDNAQYDVVAFTATQIPGISGRIYPPELSGPRYPLGIPIVAESELVSLVRSRAVDDVVFAYSDSTHEHVMHLASAALAAGASFTLLGPRDTMLSCALPVVAVVAARTGAGKSTISRYLMAALKQAGRRPVAVRHPMPYEQLSARVERYASIEELLGAGLSIEALEEYQQHVGEGSVVYAGVDYALILAAAEREADVIIWDGGNNDMSFVRPDITITVLDPGRPDQGARYFPGEVNIRAADLLVVNKINTVTDDAIRACIAEARALNERAAVICMHSVEAVDRPELIRGRRVLAIDDGPSLTHGGMAEGVAGRAARLLDARLVDPRKYALGTIADAFADYPQIGRVLPALGYGERQLEDLAATIAHAECEAVLIGTPAPLDRLIDIPHPVAFARFHARDVAGISLASRVLELLGS